LAATERPQLCLISPSAPDTERFPETLAAALDAVPVACVRLAAATRDEGLLGRLADACRQVAHTRDVAIVIDTHQLIAARHGLDGVHLPDGARSVRAARKLLGPDAIVGAFCGASRHEGMNAAEAGADYVSFGPIGDSALYKNEVVDLELFQWWSEMIEVPVVAEGAITRDLIAQLSPISDFIALGPEIWTQDDPIAALSQIWA
jgi:thiamine-phosphate pyrophosphorylase